MHGEDILISEEQYRNQVRGTLLIYWNVYNFFVTYANLDKVQRLKETKAQKNSVLDRWILSLLNKLIDDVTKSFDAYDTVTAIDAIKNFIAELSTWYIRRSRDRVGPTAENEEDKQAFYATTSQVLITVSQLFAPVVPFITEKIYQNLTGEESVHLSNWPKADFSLIDVELESNMKDGKELASAVLMKRKEAGVKVKTPIKEVSYKGPREIEQKIQAIVQQEVNVYVMHYEGSHGVYEVTTSVEKLVDSNNQDIAFGEAREIVRMIQEERKRLETNLAEKVDVDLPNWPIAHEDYIKKNALVNTLSQGETFSVKRIS
jgi:isoleucyl-tRNA synthetase